MIGKPNSALGLRVHRIDYRKKPPSGTERHIKMLLQMIRNRVQQRGDFDGAIQK